MGESDTWRLGFVSYTVFISHSIAPMDYPLVDHIYRVIWQTGIQAIVAERNPYYGANITVKIKAQLDASDAVLERRSRIRRPWIDRTSER